MPLPQLVAVLLVALSCLGCRGLLGNEAGHAEFEYSRAGDRVLLDSRGAARVDFVKNERDQPDMPILLPASLEEVQRLVDIAGTIDERALSDPLHSIRNHTGADGGILIRVRRAGVDRLLKIDYSQYSRSNVVRGLCDEIEAVGLFGLASSVHQRGTAEYYARMGRDDAAIEQYGDAIRSYCRWIEEVSRRYKFLWEAPDIWEAAGITTAVLPLNSASLDALRASLKRPGASPKAGAIEALRQTWNDLTREMSMRETGEFTVVTFTAPDNRSRASPVPGVPAEPASGALRDLSLAVPNTKLRPGGDRIVEEVPTSHWTVREPSGLIAVPATEPSETQPSQR